MESSASAAGPRVYVPITHPDSPVPTYAVLQFLGFSPPPDPKQSPILHTQFSPLPAPPSKLLPCPSPVSNPPSPAAPRRGASPTSSNSSDEKDKKFTSIKPSPMKKSASAASHSSLALSPGSRRNSKSLPFGATISISHTDKDTIIHTNCSNFREVVHQLTGATRGDKDLLPVTMPTRTIVRSGASSNNDKDVSPRAAPMRTMIQNGGDINQSNAKQEAFGVSTSISITSPKLSEAGCIRRPIAINTTKLLERRKSNKVLQRLSTSCRNLPPLVPSPVTPLASDFEKICLPVTPSTSEGSCTAVITPAGSAAVLLRDAKVLSAIPSHEAKAILHSHDAEAMEGVSVAGKGLDGGDAMDVQRQSVPRVMRTRSLSLHDDGDAIDVQRQSVPRVMRTRSLSLHDGLDVQVPSVHHTIGVQGSSPVDAMDVQGPSSILVSSTQGLRLEDAMDVQHGVVTQEPGLHDAMDAERRRLACSSARVRGLCSMRRDSNSACNEELVIAKKGFFFHSERPRHGDTVLLHLFPESPREL